MTIARHVVPNRTYLISRRCAQRRFLLRPEPIVNEIYLYGVAEAVERYGITLNGCVQMANHHHLVARDNQGNLPEFLRHMHAMLAKAMNAFRGRWENFWASTQTNVVHLVEREDRFAKLIYLLANPVAAHLVERVTEWPGASSYKLNLSEQRKTIKRPTFFRTNGNMPPEAVLRIERPAGFESHSSDEWRARLLGAVTAEEERAWEERRQSGRQVLGRNAILHLSINDSPQTVEARRTLRPTLACRNEERRRVELAVQVAFRAERKAALARMRDGERDVVLPRGTYPIRLPCARP